MTWTILLIKKSDNGWFINYIENKLLRQIIKNKLENYINVIVFEPNTKFSGDYISVIDDDIDFSDDFIKIIYDSIKNCNKDCIGLKGVAYFDEGNHIVFNNIAKNDDEAYLPVTKLNPIRKDIIFNNVKHISFYINSKVLSSIVKTIDHINEPVVFVKKYAFKVPVSIIITAYKTEKYIEECLDSVEKQSYFIDNDNFEILVGVDGCIDTYNKLQEIKDKYRNLHIYMMSENKGTYITTNTLIDLVKNENVIRFDSDDIMTTNLVSEVINDKKDNDIVLLGSVDLVNGQIGSKLLITEGIIYFKKSVMDNIAGGYKPWICSADSELIRRLINKVKIFQIKKALFYRRMHSESLTQRMDTGYSSEIRSKYRNQIKNSYDDNEIKIERVVNNVGKIKLYDENIRFKNANYLTVIIPVYKNSDILKSCLTSFLTSTFDFFNLLIINDSPADLSVDTVAKEFEREFYNTFNDSEYIYTKNYINLGFIKTVNRGINMVSGDIIILNSDTLVSSNWMERMIIYKTMYKNIASITPLSNSASQCSFPIQHQNQAHYKGLRSNLIDDIFSRVPMEMSHTAPTGVGFCMFMTRNAISKIGIFDEINFKIGYGEENEWCYRAIEIGFINIIAANIYVAHEHGASFSTVKNLNQIRFDNKNALITKYPNFFSIVSDYNSKKYLDNIYALVKFALDFEYFEKIKKPIKLIIGKYKSDSKDLIYLEYEDKIKIMYNEKTIEFTKEIYNFKTIIYLLNPESIEIHDDIILQKDELDIIKKFENRNVKKTIVIEMPYYDNILSSGISRMQRLVLELPKYSMIIGGIRESLKFLNKFPSDVLTFARFQRIQNREVPTEFENWSVGMPDLTFPECDVCITYSDNPYLSELVKLPQVNKVLIYMLSYGMAIHRERKNVMTENVTVMCSTKKLEKAISADGVKVHRVGFSLDMNEMYCENLDRKKYLAIMYHNSEKKKYSVAVEVANYLYDKKIIDGVITFGTDVGYSNAKHPKGLIKHYFNANRDEIREVFNTCQCFLMPSITEGLNLTPVESTLCGCPAIICDGAIDELFFDKENCFIVEKNNKDGMINKTKDIIENFNIYSESFSKNMYNISKEYTWENVIQNIMKLI